jgi:N utilization substance protein B
MPESCLSFARELASGAVDKRYEINVLIRQFLKNWALDRVERVTLAILRIATYELLHRKDIPAAVVIDEAIELGKFYAGPDSKRLINGVLDRIRRHLEWEKTTPHQPEVADSHCPSER